MMTVRHVVEPLSCCQAVEPDSKLYSSVIGSQGGKKSAVRAGKRMEIVNGEINGTGHAILERLQRDGFNDTKYKIVLTLDRLKAL